MGIPIKVAVYRGAEFVGEHRFDREIIKIGRLQSAHLKLEDPKVSRIHAVIEVSSDGQELAIIDMGSSDGTFVNGERISKERLKHGDEVRLGDCRLVIALDDGKAAQAAPPPMAAPVAAPVPHEAWAAQENVPTGMVSAAMPGAFAGAAATAYAAAPTVQPYAPTMPAPGGAQAWGQPGGWPPVGMSAEDARAAQFAPTGQWQLAGQAAPGMVPGAAWVDPNTGAVTAQVMANLPPDLQATGQMPLQAGAFGYAQYPGYAQPGYPQGYAGGFPTPELASGVPMSADQYQAAMAQAAMAQAMAYGQPGMMPGAPGQDVAMGGYPMFSVNTAWGTVPNNLAGEGVRDTERELEIKTIWADSVLDTINVFDQPVITMGDEPKVEGAFIWKKLVRCDVEVPAKGLPTPRFPLAVNGAKEACAYSITLHASFSGHIERQDGTVVSLQEIVAAGVGIEPGSLHDTFLYTLQPAETLYVKHGMLTLQIRYVRRQRFVPPPFLDRMNYTWLNTLILVMFFHALAVASFLALPKTSETLEDSLYKNKNRFAQILLTPEQKKKLKDDTLAKLKSGETGAKAAKAEGKAGRKDLKDVKNPGRMAIKGDPNDKEIAKSTMARLFGPGDKGSSYLFGSGGLGGELKGALGGVTGAQVGDAAGLGGLGTRGAGPGGGGLSMNSVGLGALGTQGRGGGGEGSDYGSGVGGLGKKSDRDINISAGQPVIMGSLDKELIRRVIEAHKAQIRYCYEKELVRSPGLFGKVEMEWTIGADGLVKDSKPKASTMNNAEVERCIASKIRTWEFPKPKGGGVVIVRYPFVLKTAG